MAVATLVSSRMMTSGKIFVVPNAERHASFHLQLKLTQLERTVDHQSKPYRRFGGG